MQGDIFVETNELRQAASSMASIIGGMAQIQEAIARIHNNKTTAWEGRASAQSSANFGALNGMIGNYLARSQKTVKTLEKAAGMYDASEKIQSISVSRLSTENIF